MAFVCPNPRHCRFVVSSEDEQRWLYLEHDDPSPIDGGVLQLLTAGPFESKEDAERLLLWLLAGDASPIRSVREIWPAGPSELATFDIAEPPNLEASTIDSRHRLLILSGNEELIGCSWWFRRREQPVGFLTWLRSDGAQIGREYVVRVKDVEEPEETVWLTEIEHRLAREKRDHGDLSDVVVNVERALDNERRLRRMRAAWALSLTSED